VRIDTEVHPTPAQQIANWEYEADVVIAGYGIAGAAAAVEAAGAGADVLVLERTGGWGGAAAMAGGFIYLGGGNGLQRACGFDDSVDNMAAFLNAAMGPGADEKRIADYCEGSVEHFDWLVRCGVPFKPVFWGEPGWEPPADEGLMFTGGENAYPFNTIATPAPRGHVPQMANKKAGEASAGYMLMKPLVDTATSLGVRSIYDMHVQSLVVAQEARMGEAHRHPGRRDRSSGQLCRVHPWGASDHPRRRGAARQRCADPGAVRGRPHHLRSRCVGLCQRNLPRRRQFLRPPRRAVGG
jgi:3-oxo-5alpha-steroid 4-dehydrogenase